MSEEKGEPVWWDRLSWCCCQTWTTLSKVVKAPWTHWGRQFVVEVELPVATFLEQWEHKCDWATMKDLIVFSAIFFLSDRVYCKQSPSWESGTLQPAISMVWQCLSTNSETLVVREHGSFFRFLQTRHVVAPPDGSLWLSKFWMIQYIVMYALVACNTESTHTSLNLLWGSVGHLLNWVSGSHTFWLQPSRATLTNSNVFTHFQFINISDKAFQSQI